MTTSLVLTLYYLPLSTMTAVLLVVAFFRRGYGQANRMFVMMCAMVLGWQVMEMCFLLAGTYQSAVFFFFAKLPFVAFSAVALLLFCVYFYRLEIYTTYIVVVLLCVVPACTTTLALASDLQPLIFESIVVYMEAPVRYAVARWGVWMWVHSLYSYGLMALSAFIVIRQHRRKLYHPGTPSGFLLAGVLTTLISNILTAFRLVHLDISFSLLCMSVSMLLVFIAVGRNQQLNFLALARTKIFNYLEEYIFILDNSWHVVEANTSARGWLRSVGISSHNLNLEKLMAHFDNIGGELRNTVEPENGTDVYAVHSASPVVYNLRGKAVLDQDGSQLGMFVTVADVTRNRLLIEQLEEYAGLDPLTGLANRRGYQQFIEKMDRPAYLPLSVIIGDVNGLKRLNDSLGHDQGDRLLRLVSHAIQSQCPKSGLAARIGGDEFVMVLPGVGRDEVARIARSVQKQISENDMFSIEVSIAMGMATKEQPEENLEELIRIADGFMYSQKREGRGAGV